MTGILAVQSDGFVRQELGDGGARWIAEEIFHRHGSRVAMVNYPAGHVVCDHIENAAEVLYVVDGHIKVQGVMEAVHPGSLLSCGPMSSLEFSSGDGPVAWLSISSPERTGNATLAREHIDGTKLSSSASDRGSLVTKDEIAKMPWATRSGNRYLRERRISPREHYLPVTMVKAEVLNEERLVASRWTLLFVLAGTLRVNDIFCKRGGVVSIPIEESYWPTGMAEGVTFLRVEAAES